MNKVVATVRLRSSMTAVSGLLQNARTMAVQRRRPTLAGHFVNANAPHNLVYFPEGQRAKQFVVRCP